MKPVGGASEVTPHGSTLSVAMCTFNGAPYVGAQLASIAQQTLLPDELVVCDDGSTDGTVEILRGFSGSTPFPVRILTSVERLGVVRNFERALGESKGQYVALADQDDEWEPERLATGLQAIRRGEANADHPRPMLVHSDMCVIDAHGAALDASFFARRGFRRRHPDPLRELVLQNYVTGCSALVNRALVELALPFPADLSIHDWWLALLAAAAGCVETLEARTVRYRSHGANAIGAKRVEWRAYMHRESAHKLFRRALRESKAVERRLEERGVWGPGGDFLRAYHQRTIAGGAAAALSLLRDGVRLQNALPTAVFYGQVLFRRLAVR